MEWRKKGIKRGWIRIRGRKRRRMEGGRFLLVNVNGFLKVCVVFLCACVWSANVFVEASKCVYLCCYVIISFWIFSFSWKGVCVFFCVKANIYICICVCKCQCVCVFLLVCEFVVFLLVCEFLCVYIFWVYFVCSCFKIMNK